MKVVEERVVDQPVLKLLRAMLRAGVMESVFVRHRCCTRWRVRSSLALAKAALLHEPGSGEIGRHASGSEMS
jgi:hypothetical protein